MKEKSTDFVTPTKASGEAQEEEISPTILEAAKTLSKVASQGVSKEKSTDKGKRYRRRAREEINTGIEEVSTGSTKVDSGTASKRGQREGKAPMVEEDIQASHKTKEQMRQEQAGLEEAIKLQAQLDEEVAKQIHLDKMVAKRMAEEEALSEQQKKRKAQVQFEAQFYTEEEKTVDVIKAKLNGRNGDSRKETTLPREELRQRETKPMDSVTFKIYMSKLLKNQGGIGSFHKVKEVEVEDKVAEVKVRRASKKNRKKDEAKRIEKVYMSLELMVKDFTREDLIELVLWSDLHDYVLIHPLNEDAPIWSLPLQQMMIVGEQTATGKEISNSLIADSLLKTKSCEEKTKTKRQNLSKATNPLQAKELLQIKEMADQDTPPPTITAMKIPIIKKGEYDLWSMRMRQYICHTDHNMWDIIVNGDLEDEPTSSGEQYSPPVPKTAKQLAARRNQERIKSILLLAIPDEYLLKFHNVPDAKSLWAAIKSRFGGNEESKKMQKNVLKHQFENFVTASNETLDKAYDRFQKLISQLEIHGAYVSKEDINQKFLRSLPPSWSQIALIMRNN
ncbi:hypothetical protein Tco_0456301 [Tanacetum coccineum]